MLRVYPDSDDMSVGERMHQGEWVPSICKIGPFHRLYETSVRSSIRLGVKPVASSGTDPVVHIKDEFTLRALLKLAETRWNTPLMSDGHNNAWVIQVAPGHNASVGVPKHIRDAMQDDYGAMVIHALITEDPELDQIVALARLRDRVTSSIHTLGVGASAEDIEVFKTRAKSFLNQIAP